MMTTLTALDPNGNIPLFVVNKLAPQRALAVARARNLPPIADKEMWGECPENLRMAGADSKSVA